MNIKIEKENDYTKLQCLECNRKARLIGFKKEDVKDMILDFYDDHLYCQKNALKTELTKSTTSPILHLTD